MEEKRRKRRGHKERNEGIKKMKCNSRGKTIKERKIKRRETSTKNKGKGNTELVIKGKRRESTRK